MKFKKVYIELSDICGLKCSFCPNPKNTRGVMSKELFEKILQEVKGKTKAICLHVLGDPCRLKDLGDYLFLIHKYGLKVDLVTSGYYLANQEILMHNCIHQVAFSLDAGFDKNNPTKLDYLDKILSFCALRMQNQESRVFVNLRIQDSNQNQDLIKKICEFFGVEIFELKTFSRIKLAEYIFLNVTKTFEWASLDSKKSNPSKYCHAIKEQIAILSNGIVVPCCIDSMGQIELGDIKKQNLNQIYHASRAQKIKEGFARGEAIEELCKKCQFPTTRQ